MVEVTAAAEAAPSPGPGAMRRARPAGTGSQVRGIHLQGCIAAAVQVQVQVQDSPGKLLCLSVKWQQYPTYLYTSAAFDRTVPQYTLLQCRAVVGSTAVAGGISRVSSSSPAGGALPT